MNNIVLVHRGFVDSSPHQPKTGSSSRRIRATATSRAHFFPDIDRRLRIILPKTEGQRAERRAERCVNRIDLGRRIVGQDFNSDVGIAHRPPELHPLAACARFPCRLESD
jgi:hypothetical protein